MTATNKVRRFDRRGFLKFNWRRSCDWSVLLLFIAAMWMPNINPQLQEGEFTPHVTEPWPLLYTGRTNQELSNLQLTSDNMHCWRRVLGSGCWSTEGRALRGSEEWDCLAVCSLYGTSRWYGEGGMCSQPQHSTSRCVHTYVHTYVCVLAVRRYVYGCTHGSCLLNLIMHVHLSSH